MRLATIITPNGPRLHVKTDSGGYADIAEAAGEPGLAALTSFLAGGRLRWRRPAASRAARAAPASPRISGRPYPRPRGSSASA